MFQWKEFQIILLFLPAVMSRGDASENLWENLVKFCVEVSLRKAEVMRCVATTEFINAASAWEERAEHQERAAVPSGGFWPVTTRL